MTDMSEIFNDTQIFYGTGILAIAALIPLYGFLKTALRNSIIKKTTALFDLPNLGKPRTGPRIQGTAVVCGGSIAGLWTARVCADHFEDVLVIEPETWLATKEGTSSKYDADGNETKAGSGNNRTRVVQYHFPHIFMPLSFLAMETLFPQAKDELRASGARVLPANYMTHSGGVRETLPFNVYPMGKLPETYFATREAFETTLRRMVRESDNRIRWLSGTVTNLQMSSKEPNKIQGVLVRVADSDIEQAIPASLVIDCTGGTRAGLKWLKRLPNVKEPLDDYHTTYDPKVRYMDFRMPVPPAMRSKLPLPEIYDNTGVVYAYVPIPPQESRILVIQWLEGHRIEVCCGGWGEPDLPKVPSEIVPWIKSLRGKESVPQWVSDMVQMLRENENAAVVRDTGRVSPCAWLHYEKMRWLPSNYTAVGDSVMRVNPIYGQGCTKACVGAITLDRLLRSVKNIPSDFGKKFFSIHADRIGVMWDSTKPIDYGWDTTVPMKGEVLANGEPVRIFLKYLQILLAKGDKDASLALYQVRMCLAPGSDLFQPKILAKICLVAIQQSLGF